MSVSKKFRTRVDAAFESADQSRFSMKPALSFLSDSMVLSAIFNALAKICSGVFHAFSRSIKYWRICFPSGDLWIMQICFAISTDISKSVCGLPPCSEVSPNFGKNSFPSEKPYSFILSNHVVNLVPMCSFSCNSLADTVGFSDS